jgi:hypothetical protein
VSAGRGVDPSALVIPFGKHRGATVAELLETAPDYVQSMRVSATRCCIWSGIKPSQQIRMKSKAGTWSNPYETL